MLRGIQGGGGAGGRGTHVALVDSGVARKSPGLGIAAEPFVEARLIGSGGVGALVYCDNPRSRDARVGVVVWEGRASTCDRDGSDTGECLGNGRNGRHC